jgi:hypothetical protein
MGNLNKIKDFELFCANYVKIRGFDGKVIPFIHNRGQRRLLKVMMRDLEEKGKCDLVMVKARKGGFTTFFAIFALWLAITNVGKHNILGVHHKDLIGTVSDIVNIAFNNLPKETFALTLGRDQTTDKSFVNLNSGITVSVVSNTSKIGRGKTPTAIIITEYAHIDKSHQLKAGLFSANQDVSGAIRVIETTANGTGNDHYKTYRGAKANKNGWTAFFSPWHENDRYRIDPPPSFEMNDDDIAAMKRLDLEIDQVYWRHLKLESMEADMFKQEFPENDEEAFSFSGYECYIPIDKVEEAMKRPAYDTTNRVIAGYDPAPTPTGDDKAYIERSGRNFFGLEYPYLRNEPEQINWLASKLNERDVLGKPGYWIDELYIDFGGGGSGIYDHLIERGYNRNHERVHLVNFGGTADEPQKYKNKRAEMTDRLRDGFIDPVYGFSINIEKSLEDQFKAELTSEGAKIVDGRLLIEKKDDVKKRLGFSPGGKDAAGLTLANLEAPIEMGARRERGIKMVHLDHNDSLLARI